MLQLAVYDGPGGNMRADWSHAQECIFRTHDYGFGALTAFISMPRQEAFRWFSNQGEAHLEVTAPQGRVWEGRLEDVALVGGGIRIAAFGYWNALLDVPYTALWSTKSYGPWDAITSEELATYRPDRFEMDNNNRLYIAPRTGEIHADTVLGAWRYETPDDSERPIVTVTFTYSLRAASQWRAQLLSADRGSTTFTSLWSLYGDGGTQTGTTTITLGTTKHRVAFRLYRDSTLAGMYTGDTGETYLKVTGLRVKTTSAAAVYADAIADALVAFVSGVNSGHLSSVTSEIDSPGLDLQEEAYEDEYPADILARLAGLGDDQTPPAQWETGVWEGQKLHLRERGSEGNTWYVDLATLEVERSLNELRNSVYAVYSDAHNVTQRTAIAEDSASINKYEMTRRAAVSVSTTSGTQAAVHRDALLDDRKELIPRARLEFNELYTAGGARVPLYVARSGDTIIARNLPPTLSTAIDRLRTFRLAETEYDCDTGRLTVIPEMPLASLEVLVSRREEGF